MPRQTQKLPFPLAHDVALHRIFSFEEGPKCLRSVGLNVRTTVVSLLVAGRRSPVAVVEVVNVEQEIGLFYSVVSEKRCKLCFCNPQHQVSTGSIELSDDQAMMKRCYARNTTVRSSCVVVVVVVVHVVAPPSMNSSAARNRTEQNRRDDQDQDQLMSRKNAMQETESESDQIRSDGSS